MPSFDVVSEVDLHELRNAVDQASREIGNRFDFKGVDAKFELKESTVVMTSDSDFQLKQMPDVLHHKMASRKIDIACLKTDPVQVSGTKAIQNVVVQQGIETVLAKKMVKIIKDSKMKVQAAIQGEKLRVTGKKRDELQKVMTLLKDSDVSLPLQFDNFRD